MDGETKGSPLVLVFLLPRSYSEAVGAVIGSLRPGLTVRVVEPAKLSEQVLGLRPDLVLCSQPATGVVIPVDMGRSLS